MERREVLRRVAAALPTLTPQGQVAAAKALEVLSRSSQVHGVPVDDEADRVAAEEAKQDLYKFVQLAWEYVEPDEEFRDNWHIKALCRVLMRVSAGEIKRLIINVPPGTMKSLLVSVFWPAWEWANNPALRYLTGSYTNALTIRDNLRVREIVQSPWYRRYFWNDDLARDLEIPTVKLRGDQNEKIRFNTTATGWRIATGVGGPGTGEHPDRVIIDDPLTAEEAESEAERDKAIRWVKRTLSSRGVARGARQVLIMQRLHEEDVSGYLLKQGGWEHIRWPMEYEAPKPEKPGEFGDPSELDERTEEGELLWPELFDLIKVRQLAKDLDEYGAAGQLQQRPAPIGGGLFKRAWFEIVDAAPISAVRCRFWDMAATEKKQGGEPDWTCGIKMSMSAEGVFYVEDVIREQVGPMDSDGLFLQAASIDGQGVRIREEQEPGSAGKKLVAAHLRMLRGYDYKGEPATGDKRTRARAFRAQCEGHNVKLVKGPWNEVWIKEHCSFPTGKWDDQVDASSGAFNELAAGTKPIETRAVTWG